MSNNTRQYTDNTSAINIDPISVFSGKNIDKTSKNPFSVNKNKSRIDPDHLWVIK
jgi:hypothetical protein